MKFNFSYGITLTYGQYEPALNRFKQAFCPKAKARKLNFICTPLQDAIVQHNVSSFLGCRHEV